MQCHGPWMPLCHGEVAGGICRSSASHPLCWGPRGVPSPLAKEASPYSTGTRVYPQRPQGEREQERLRSMRISNIGIFQPSPAGTLAAGWSWEHSHVLRVQAGRGQATSPSQPLSATVHHSSTEPCPRDRRAVWSLRPPGMAGLVLPHFTAGTRSMSPKQGHPFPGLEFGGLAALEGQSHAGG